MGHSHKHTGIIATAVVLASSLAIFLQCSSSSTDAGADAATASCPIDPPTIGAACAVPNDQDCTYNPGCQCCFNDIFKCVQGTWTKEVLNGKVGLPPCPTAIPSAGAACDPQCGSQTCTYACGAREAGIAVTCTDNGWQVSTDLCDAGVSVDDASTFDAGDAN